MAADSNSSSSDPATKPLLADVDGDDDGEELQTRESSEKRDEPPKGTQRPGRQHPVAAEDPRFHRPTPSPWKRAALLLFIVLLFYVGYRLRVASAKPAKVVYASRYSKEFKYRPAASPVVTERLKDGRTRVRGAQPQIIEGYQYQQAPPRRAT